MNQDSIIRIVRRCMVIDQQAASVYHHLSSNAQTADLKLFWLKILEEGRLRSAYWEKLEGWARRGMLPQFFEVPNKVLAELAVIEEKLGGLVASSQQICDLSQSIFIAFKLEFYLLHPAFESFFQYLRTVTENAGIAGAHGAINALFDALDTYGLESLELELLGETLNRLWQENRKMAIQSNTDPLTGVLNRRGFFNAIKPLAHLAQRNKSDVAVIMVDIDHFKRINDTFGHQFGDEVLRYVAGALQENIRASDLIGRYGGEEFILFLSSISKNALLDVSEKLRNAIEAGNLDFGRVTVSLGASHSRVDFPVDDQLKTLIQTADGNLLRAKDGGRNRTVI